MFLPVDGLPAGYDTGRTFSNAGQKSPLATVKKVDGRSLGQMIGQKRSQGLAGRFPRTSQISSRRRLRHRNPQLAELPMNADLERPFRPVVIRAHGQVETEGPLSVPRWPRAVR